MLSNKIITKAFGLFLFLSGLLIVFHPVQAQKNDSDTVATIQGIVVDATNGQSVENTLVLIPEMNKETFTDEIGHFKFQHVDTENDPPQKITLNVKHKAYKKFAKTIDLSNNERIMLELERKPRLQ